MTDLTQKQSDSTGFLTVVNLSSSDKKKSLLNHCQIKMQQSQWEKITLLCKNIYITAGKIPQKIDIIGKI